MLLPEITLAVVLGQELIGEIQPGRNAATRAATALGAGLMVTGQELLQGRTHSVTIDGHCSRARDENRP